MLHCTALYLPDVNLCVFPFVQDSMGGSPNDIRISDMRPTLVEPPMYKPKVVLLGKDKKGDAPTCESVSHTHTEAHICRLKTAHTHTHTFNVVYCKALWGIL